MVDHMEIAGRGYQIRDIILGGQDGLVNVLGVVLAVATARWDVGLTIIAGLAAAFAESISMMAVAYTSTKAVTDYLEGSFRNLKRRVRESPEEVRKEIAEAYRRRGFEGTLLNRIVKKIMANEKVLIKNLMEEHKISWKGHNEPVKSALVVGVSAIIGSFVPLAPFFFFGINDAIIGSVVFSTVVLFIAGGVKNMFSGRPWLRGAVELSIIGIAAALIGYGIGVLLGVTNI